MMPQSPTTAVLAAFLLLLLTARESLGFSLLSNRPFLGKSRAPPVFAIIYGEDGQRIEEDDNEEEIGSTWTEKARRDVPHDVLVELACAFAPPPNNSIHPKDVQSAALLSADSTGLHVAVGVKSHDDALAQVLVQIPATSSEDLQRLQQQARSILLDREQQGTAASAKREVTRRLQEEPLGYDLPDWWVTPTWLMDDECRSLKSLLNEEDMATELNDVFQRKQPFQGVILKTCAASVGPSGVLLRAFGQVDDAPPSYDYKEFTIRFPTEATSPDQLRTSVLEILEEDVEEKKEVPVETPSTASEEQTTAATVEKTKAETKDEAPITALVEKMEAATSEEKGKDTVRSAANISKPEEQDIQEEVEIIATDADGTTNEEKVESDDQSSEEDSFASDADVVAKADDEPAESKDVEKATVPFEELVENARRQPKSDEEESRLAAKYAAMDNVGERAHAILKDLYMI